MSKESRVQRSPVMAVVSGLAGLGLLRWLLLLAMMVLSSTMVKAQTAHCSLELDAKKRHSCFESNPMQTYKQRRPGWPILSSNSYATGNPNASATRFAEEQVMCGDIEGTTSIGVHCTDEGMKLVFSMGCSIGNANTPSLLELQTDENSSQWKAKVFRNRLGMSIEDSILANKFVKSMQGNEEVVLVFSPKDAPKFVATFKLAGFDKAAARIEEICPL